MGQVGGYLAEESRRRGLHTDRDLLLLFYILAVLAREEDTASQTVGQLTAGISERQGQLSAGESGTEGRLPADKTRTDGQLPAGKSRTEGQLPVGMLEMKGRPSAGKSGTVGRQTAGKPSGKPGQPGKLLKQIAYNSAKVSYFFNFDLYIC